MPNEFFSMFYGVHINYTKDTKCTKLFCYAYISALVKSFHFASSYKTE